MTTTAIAGTRGAGLARAVLSLFKLRIGALIMVTALVGLAVTPGARLEGMQVLERFSAQISRSGRRADGQWARKRR